MDAYQVLIMISGICAAALAALNLLYPDIIRRAHIIQGCVIGAMGVGMAYLIGAQYLTWHASPGTVFLLPPHKPLSYFIMYVGIRFIAPYLISFSAGYMLWIGMRLLNKRSEGRFFYNDELVYAPLALFLVGYPGVLVYLLLFLILFVFFSLIRSIIASPHITTSMRYLWLPLTVCVILLDKLVFSNLSWWGLLKL